MIKKENFNFLSSDNKTKINACKWYKEETNHKAIIQLTHGMIEYIDRYDDFAKFLAENDFLVIGHDHLGHGDSVESEKNFGYFGKHPSRLVVSDMNKLRKKFFKEDVPYFILGHSMGSYMLRKYLSIYGNDLSGAIIMGTGYIPGIVTTLGKTVAHLEALFLGWRHRSKLLQKLSYDKYYKRYSLDGSDSKNSWLTKDEEKVKKYYQDPKSTYIFTDNGYLGLFEAVEYSCKKKNIDKIPKDLPILFVSGKEDPVGQNGKGVEKVYRLFKEKNIQDVSLKLYENDRHEILNEIDKEKVYKDILDWLNSKIEK